MLYTTYFAKLRSLPDNVIPISICAKAPEWYSGIQYKKLAPKYDILNEWKKTHDNERYIQRFCDEVISHLDVISIADELQVLIPEEVKMKMQAPFWWNKDWHIALVCYEKSSDFCHRHLVSAWFNENGYPCSEWDADKT